MEQGKHPFPHGHVLSHHAAGNQTTYKTRLDRQTILLLIVNFLFAAAVALSGTFVTVYLWKANPNFVMIAWFMLLQQVISPTIFWIGGKWVKEHNKMHSLRIGIVLSAMFYLVVLWLGTKAVHYIVVLGILQGMASGFFWLAFNVVYFEVTEPGNRDKFNGWAGLLGSGAGMLAPWISGYLITTLSGARGYRIVFTMSLVIFLIGVIVSFFLTKRKVKGQYYWFKAWKVLGERHNPWRRLVPALVAQGTREGVFGFLIGLLVYIATKQELKLGNYTLITSGVALVSFFIVGKMLKPQYRIRAMFIGTVMLMLVILPFFWKLDYMTLLIFGMGTALFIPLYIIPMTSSVFDQIGHDEQSAQLRVEYIVLREVSLCFGRVVSIAVFILVISWSQATNVLIWLVLAIGSSPIVAWWYMRKLSIAAAPLKHKATNE